MTANILLARIAAAVPIKPCHGLYRTELKRLAQHIAGCRAPSASITCVVPQHGVPWLPVRTLPSFKDNFDRIANRETELAIRAPPNI